MTPFSTILALILISGLTYIHLNLLPKALHSIPRTSRSGGNSGHHEERCEGSKVITPELSAYIGETMRISNTAGLSVAIVPKDGDPYLKAWGYRSEEGEEITSDTLFHIASVSKAFCASALGILMDDFANGRNVTALPPKLTEITWHTKVKDLLPDDWELMDEWASEHANLKDILAHVSGVMRHDFSYGLHDTTMDLVKRLKYLRPGFELREQWSYNNIMFVVGAHIVSKYANQPYTSFVQERIFVPLDMSSTTFSPRKAAESGKYTQAWTKAGRLIPDVFTEEFAFTSAGSGGIISNAIDMSKWIATWLNEGVYNGTAVIPRSVYWNTTLSYAIYRGHPADASQSISGYGLGWFRGSYRGHDSVSHAGGIPGATTLVSFFPGDGFGVLVFANGGDQDVQVKSISNRIIDKILCLVDPHPVENRSPAVSFEPKVIEIVSTASNLPVSLNDLAGTYTNPGYGTFTLCSSNSTSFYCSKVYTAFTTVDGVRGNLNPSVELLAEWSRFWSSHVRMRHKGGMVFSVYMTSLFPNGYGKDSSPFETAEVGISPIMAEFVIDHGKVSGFGVIGLEGRQIERARLGSTVKDRAEVWFDKVRIV